MGLVLGQLEVLLQETLRRPFYGSLATLGKLDIYFSHRDFKKAAFNNGVTIGDPECLVSPIKPDAIANGHLSDINFFEALGFTNIDSIDYKAYEGAKIIFDLNQAEMPIEMKNNYDVVCDFGTLEHVFNVPNALNNIFNLLRVGGRVIHISPSSNHVDHGFYMFSPTLYYDYYSANEWEINLCQYYTLNVKGDRNALFKRFDYTPKCLGHLSLGGFDLKDSTLNIILIATKKDVSTGTRTPQQYIYTNYLWTPENPEFKQKKEPKKEEFRLDESTAITDQYFNSSNATMEKDSGPFDYQDSLKKLSSTLLASSVSNNEALFQLRRLVVNYANDAESHQLLGDGYLQSGKLPQAREAYAVALAMSENHDGSSIGMAKYLWLSGKIDEAKNLLSEIQSRSPQNADAYLVAGQIEMVSGNMPESVSAFETAARICPQDAIYQCELGRAYYLAGKTVEAEKVWRKAAALESADSELFNLLATLYWKNGQTESALRDLRQALELNPYNPKVRKTFNTISAVQNKKKQDEKLVVFIGDWPRTRQAKLAYGLRSAGWKAVLLCKNTLGNDLTSHFDEVRYYKEDSQAVALANTYSPKVYHVFSSWSESTAVAMIKHKPGKVVYDCYDVVEGIAGGESSIPDQKYCIENADAICCKDLRYQYLKRRLHYRLPFKRIFFPEYCWNNPVQVPQKNHFSKKDGEIHVVVCGSIDLEKLNQHDNVYLELARIFSHQGVHLHIYPAPTNQIYGTFENLFSDFIELQDSTPYFHLHRSIPIEQVIPTMSKFDIGSLLVHPLVFGTPLERYSQFQFDYSCPARVFDYIDAGLPVLASKAQRLSYFWLSRFNLVKEVTPGVLSDLRNQLRDFISPEIRSRISNARSAYAVSHQINRLTEFYESL